MDTEKVYKTPSYMRRSNLNYYYRCKENPEKQETIKNRQRKNAKAYYEKNKDLIKEKQRVKYQKQKEEKKQEQELNKKKELSIKLNERELNSKKLIISQ